MRDRERHRPLASTTVSPLGNRGVTTSVRNRVHAPSETGRRVPNPKKSRTCTCPRSAAVRAALPCRRSCRRLAPYVLAHAWGGPGWRPPRDSESQSERQRGGQRATHKASHQWREGARVWFITSRSPVPGPATSRSCCARPATTSRDPRPRIRSRRFRRRRSSRSQGQVGRRPPAPGRRPLSTGAT